MTTIPDLCFEEAVALLRSLPECLCTKEQSDQFFQKQHGSGYAAADVLRAHVRALEEQGIWWMIRDAFAQDSDLQKIRLIVDDSQPDFDGDYCLMVESLRTQDQQNDWTAQRGGPEEELQISLNGLRDEYLRPFFDRAAEIEFDRNELDVQATDLLGEGFASAVSQRRLDQDVPNPRPAKNKNRL